MSLRSLVDEFVNVFFRGLAFDRLGVEGDYVRFGARVSGSTTKGPRFVFVFVPVAYCPTESRVPISRLSWMNVQTRAIKQAPRLPEQSLKLFPREVSDVLLTRVSRDERQTDYVVGRN